MARSVSYPSGAIVAFEQHGCDEGWCWDDYLDDIAYRLKEQFPSLSGDDRWLDREDHAIMSNGHVFAGVSEYMGMAAIWMVVRPDIDGSAYYIAQHWLEQVEARFQKHFGELEKVAVFSNGEAVYRKKEGVMEDNLDGPLVINGNLCHGVYAA